MKLLIDEYSSLVLTIIGGLIILSIIISSCLQININTYHNEELNKLNPIIERISSLDCKDIMIDSLNDDLLLNVKAYSNTGKDISDRVIARLIQEDNKRYVEYILKYNNDFSIKRVNCYLKEDSTNEDDV